MNEGIDFLKLKSKVCLSPNQCYELTTDVPVWMLILLIGSAYLLVKDIIKN